MELLFCLFLYTVVPDMIVVLRGPTKNNPKHFFCKINIQNKGTVPRSRPRGHARRGCCVVQGTYKTAAHIFTAWGITSSFPHCACVLGGGFTGSGIWCSS